MITIRSHSLLPMEPGETPGMPSYLVKGEKDDVPFSLKISVEIDGLDVNFEDIQGVDPDNLDILMEIFDALSETYSWIDQHNQQAAAYYQE